MKTTKLIISLLSMGLIVFSCSKSIKKYYKTKYLNLNLRLLLNHVIILHNFFNGFGTTILFRVIPKDHYPLLNTILIFLDRLPKHMYTINMQTDANIQRELESL